MAYNTVTHRITLDYEMVEKSCYTCKFPFLVPQWFEKQCREDKRQWFCPACREPTIYSESDVDRLKRQLNDQVAYWQRQYESEQTRATIAENRRRAAAGQITKLRKRVGNGVCPCCQRTFSQLARHMKAKHPDFKEAEAGPARALDAGRPLGRSG